MAAIVYNGLQTCLESQIRETRILRLKLSSLPSSSSSSSIPIKSSASSYGCSWGGFSSLHALSEPEKDESTAIYVHPLQGRCSSSMVLSEKSLQLCTENLGNETGTDTTDMNCNMDSLETWEERKPARLAGAKKTICMASFPPPLTTIRGSETVRVKSRREEGRLVIEAVKVPTNAMCSFRAERSHGRLTLSFFKSTVPFDDEEDDEENEVTNNLQEFAAEIENDINGQRQNLDEENNGEAFEDLRGNKFIPGGDMGMEIYEITNTCKKDDH